MNQRHRRSLWITLASPSATPVTVASPGFSWLAVKVIIFLPEVISQVWVTLSSPAAVPVSVILLPTDTVLLVSPPFSRRARYPPRTRPEPSSAASPLPIKLTTIVFSFLFSSFVLKDHLCKHPFRMGFPLSMLRPSRRELLVFEHAVVGLVEQDADVLENAVPGGLVQPPQAPRVALLRRNARVLRQAPAPRRSLPSA